MDDIGKRHIFNVIYNVCVQDRSALEIYSSWIVKTVSATFLKPTALFYVLTAHHKVLMMFT